MCLKRTMDAFIVMDNGNGISYCCNTLELDFEFVLKMVRLKAGLFINVFSAHIKGRSRCYASLLCEEHGHVRTCHIYNTGKTLYMGIEFSLQLENRQQIMPNNVETKHAQAHVFVILW